MQTFTGWQYLLIDAANAYGLDKLEFEPRISWAENALPMLEQLYVTCPKKTLPLFVKATIAIRKAQKGIPTGHLVGFDAVCSGMQIMSVLTGCEAGAKATGLIDKDRRPDAYTDVTKAMNSLLGITMAVDRDDAKSATMTSLYGSKAQPKNIFGDGTKELAAFYDAMNIVAPGPWQLLQALLASWQSHALSHSWTLPDGFEAKVKVMDKVETRIEVDELEHSSFTYEYRINRGLPLGHAKSKSNAANVVHSFDAYVLRSVHRRCNYDPILVEQSYEMLAKEASWRQAGGAKMTQHDELSDLGRYIELWEQTQMADVVILPHLDPDNVNQLPDELLTKLMLMTASMLQYKPFEVVTIHDEFKCHPNHMNALRAVYRNILADLADSEALSFVLSSIHGHSGRVTKITPNLSQKIRESNYALC